MSAGYAAVTWSRHKVVYDLLVAAGVVLYLATFVLISKLVWRGDEAISDEVLLIRGTGSCALVLVHITLSLGPLARLQPRLLPVLFNRRHLGVATFLVALVHGLVTVGYYHGFGFVNPLYSLLTSNTNYGSVVAFPFETLGVLALLLLFVLAATSHDFWLKNLTAVWWKAIHMSVYAVYALLVLHVLLGPIQGKAGIAPLVLMLVGAGYLGALHAFTGVREWKADRAEVPPVADDSAWLDVGEPGEIPMNRAKVVSTPGGERVAVFRHEGGVSAVTNVCAHQGGPLGEGAVINGCITCPWHGWQYKPGDGCAPPPFVEKVKTYQVRILAGRVQVRAEALAPGTETPPAKLPVSPVNAAMASGDNASAVATAPTTITEAAHVKP